MTQRIRVLYAILVLIGGIFSLRLFNLQVLEGETYANSALNEQLKKYEIAPDRGRIYAREGDSKVPLVLNDLQPTLYADPRYVTDPLAAAKAVAGVIGGDIEVYRREMATTDNYYVVLKKRLNAVQAREIEKLALAGIGLQDATYRTYPEGNLAAQLLGFVNDDGTGQYGVEGFLNDELAGEPGLLRAVTDVNGIPLTSDDDSIIKDSQDGTDVVLTIDRYIQRAAEQALANGVKAASAKSGSAIVIDPSSGAILAMANYPSYAPAKFSAVKDAAVYLNGVVSTPYEVGSVAKPFTMSAGLNEGKITPQSTYFDAGFVQVDDKRIENAGVSGGVSRTMTEVIQKSVNTGVVHVLKELGGADQVNQTGRNVLFDYFTKHYGFGSLTGVEQAAEAAGVLYAPDSGEGNNVKYANMTFGQGMTLTMLQTVAAYSALVNGGTYFQPYLVHSRIDRLSGDDMVSAPKALRTVVSDKTSRQIRAMMEKVVQLGGGFSAKRAGYIIGGKTGTSQKLAADGTYSDYLETGSFLGFGAGDKPAYVIMIKVDEPGIPGYAGTVAAAPIFANISNQIIDYYRLSPVR
ncbi:MAG TPA: penicillin-binding protein 2 [Candidatus Saccharimonadales bacterium]